MVVAVNFCFLGKEEGGGGANHSSRSCSRGGRGGGGGPRDRGEESSIGGICSGISATITSTTRIVSLISSSRLCMSVRVYPAILS